MAVALGGSWGRLNGKKFRKIRMLSFTYSFTAPTMWSSIKDSFELMSFSITMQTYPKENKTASSSRSFLHKIIKLVRFRKHGFLLQLEQWREFIFKQTQIAVLYITLKHWIIYGIFPQQTPGTLPFPFTRLENLCANVCMCLVPSLPMSPSG